MRRVREPGDESGFTLPEVVACVVLMSIVMLGVASALIQALEIPTQSRDQSMTAANRTLAVQTFSDDVANAYGVAVQGSYTTSSDQSQEQKRSTCTSSTTPVSLITLTWTNSSGSGETVNYSLQYGSYNSTTATVALIRTSTIGASPDTTTMLSGYCFLGTAPSYSDADQVLSVLDVSAGNMGATYSYQLQRISAQFYMRDSATSPASKINIEGAVRRECLATGASQPSPLTPALPSCF
jgi:prepilin-type N-terminal cleavage/methylation domain-containing protein